MRNIETDPERGDEESGEGGHSEVVGTEDAAEELARLEDVGHIAQQTHCERRQEPRAEAPEAPLKQTAPHYALNSLPPPY